MPVVIVDYFVLLRKKDNTEAGGAETAVASVLPCSVSR
jgi:hypothetical protein